ncbi:MAG: DNA polymerase III subunit gamma/tau [Atribacterota bacterium]|nr:DNA polymerase III subunit gamma/tau [Atribacterota bacterium]
MVQYQSMYRKWRPQLFEDIVGQKHITRTLMNAIKLNRIGHAYIFSGPRGVGKTTTARILAKALNCQEGPTDHPCNKCSQCIRINSGQSLDVIEIDGASNRGIDEIRELRSKIGFAPAEGKYKVYIIDEVHMLTNEAFNALLKTLEEPPSEVLFIFATTAPQKVPNTILSRCQCFNFRRISIDEIVLKLKRIIDREKLKSDLPSLRLIAESATGSMRDAESILDQVVAFSSEDKVSFEEVKEILGIIPKELFFQITRAILNHDSNNGLELIDKLVKEGVDLHQFVQDMIIYVHQLSLIKILGKNTLLEEKDSEKITKLIAGTDVQSMLNIIEELNKIEDKIKYHHYPWILLELLIVKLTQSGKTGQVKKITKNTIDNNKIFIEEKEEDSSNHREVGSEIKTVKAIFKKPANNINKNKMSNEVVKEQFEFSEIWPKVLSRVKKERISLYAFLSANSEVFIENNQLMIGFHHDCLFHKESLEKRENREKVEAVLKEVANLDIRLNCFISKKNNKVYSNYKLEKNENKKENKYPGNHDSNIPEANKKKKKNIEESTISDNGILEEARDLFGGNIIED